MSNKVIYFYSKFSQSCKLIQPYIQQIANNINLQLVDIDNSQLRDYIESLNVISSVPCIIMVFPAENRLEIHEGNDVIAFINKVLTLTNRPPISNLNTSISTSSTSSGSAPQIPNMRVNSPSIPKAVGKTQLNLEEMSNQPKKPPVGIVKIDDPFSAMAEQMKEPSYKNMYAERLQLQEHIKKGDGHEGMGRSSLSSVVESSSPGNESIPGATPLDFGDNYASDSSSSNNDTSLIIQKSEVNISDMHGNASTTNRESDVKSDRIKSSAASMAAEREAFESSLNIGGRR